MKEKINQIINNEKLRSFSKKVFTKRNIRGAIAAIVIIVGLKVGYAAAFEVNGTVMKVDSKSIEVRNFLGTKTVNLGDYPLNTGSIVVGEKVEIKKNLSGDVIAIRTDKGRGGDRRFGQAGGDRVIGEAQNGQQQGENGIGKGTKQGQNGKQVQGGQQGPNRQLPSNGQGSNGQQGTNNQQAPSGQGAQPGAPAQAPASGDSGSLQK